MTEQEKAIQGYLYNPADPTLTEARHKCAQLCYAYNQCNPADQQTKQALLQQMLGNIAGDIHITAPFYCDYGYNISVGNHFYTNYNCTILDCAPVTFGDSVFLAPGCVFTTAGHAIDQTQRAEGLEIALPIHEETMCGLVRT